MCPSAKVQALCPHEIQVAFEDDILVLFRNELEDEETSSYWITSYAALD
jgi:hypothetical protein